MMKLEQKITEAWYQNQPWIYVFSPFEFVYKRLINFRKKLYKKGFLKSNHPGIPVIIVGNITVGGTGKTPVVIEIIKHLKKRGWTPGVISRGYGGQVKEFPFLVTAQTEANECGDEPVLIFRNTHTNVVIDRDRFRAAELLKKMGCNIIVSDDGMQHLALQRDYEILIVDGNRGFGNEHLLPVGPLRESVERVAQCDFVLTNGDNNLSPELKNSDNFVIKAQYLVELETQQQFPLAWLNNKEFHALAGIGNTDRFFTLLQKLGGKPVCHSFPDHHQYQLNDIPNDKKSLVVTEKDAVKLEQFNLLDCFYLSITAELPQRFYRHLDVFLESISSQLPKVNQ